MFERVFRVREFVDGEPLEVVGLQLLATPGARTTGSSPTASASRTAIARSPTRATRARAMRWPSLPATPTSSCARRPRRRGARPARPSHDSRGRRGLRRLRRPAAAPHPQAERAGDRPAVRARLGRARDRLLTEARPAGWIARSDEPSAAPTGVRPFAARPKRPSPGTVPGRGSHKARPLGQWSAPWQRGQTVNWPSV